MKAAGMALRLFREVRGLGQEEASVRVGLNKNQAGRWELGKNVSRLDNLKMYADSLGAPVPLIIDLFFDKTATPIRGLIVAAKYLVDSGYPAEEIQRLNLWQSRYGDQAVSEAISQELDD